MTDTDSGDSSKLSDTDKLVIDATIKRQTSLLDLMKHTDTRAQQFIGFYTALAGAAAALATSDVLKHAPEPIRVLLVGYGALLLLGAVFAFQACQTVNLTLPSRSSDFWIAFREAPKEGIAKFLLDADVNDRRSEELQRSAGSWLQRTMIVGQIAIALAVLTAFIATFKLR